MLREVQLGGSVRIWCHHAKGAVRNRLLNLGFVLLTGIQVIRKASLGDPLECNVGNYKVALCATEAGLIEVEVD